VSQVGESDGLEPQLPDRSRRPTRRSIRSVVAAVDVRAAAAAAAAAAASPPSA